MATVIRRVDKYTGEYEDVDSMLKRFKKQIANEGLMQELRTREYYKTPAERKREKRERNAKRLKK